MGSSRTSPYRQTSSPCQLAVELTFSSSTVAFLNPLAIGQATMYEDKARPLGSPNLTSSERR